MSVGGKVVQVYNRGDKLWINTVDSKDYCSVMVESEHDIQIGTDTIWWQSGDCYWTRRDAEGNIVFQDKKIKKMSGSGADHPLGKEYELKYDFQDLYKQKKEQFNMLKQRYEENFGTPRI